MKEQQRRRGSASKERRLVRYEEHIPGFELTVGKVNQNRAYDPIAVHTHKGCFEIVYIVKGRQIYTIGDAAYQVESGQCFMTLPDEQHSSGGYPEDKSILYYVIFSQRLLADMGFDETESKMLQERLLMPASRIFQGTQEMLPVLEALATLPEQGEWLHKTKIRHYFTQYVLQVAAQMGQAPQSEVAALEAVLAYIEGHIGENLSIQELAQLTNLSESRFKAYFRGVIGIPPGEYILRQKVQKAKVWLETTDDTVTAIAYALSFSSSQYFATVFKRFTTFSPAQYRMLYKVQ